MPTIPVSDRFFQPGIIDVKSTAPGTTLDGKPYNEL